MVLKIGTKPGATFWLNSEPCGLICGCMTWFLLFFGMYATTAGVIVPWLGFSPFGLLNILIFNGLSLIALYSHIKVMTTDPGSVPPRARPLQDDDQEIEYAMHRDNCADPSIPFKKYCRRCKAYKPQRAHHCSICGRCIVKMDHHCPWVNNCVGVGNHKLFLLFVFWTFVTCMYSMLLVLIKYISCIGGGHKCHASSRHQLLVIFLVVESILFGLFTLCMLGDQLSAISSNQTAIDRLKGTKHNYQMEINEVCGSARNIKFHHSWLMPVPVRFPDGVVKDKVLGYRLSRGSSNGEGEEFNPLMASTHGSVNGSSNVEEGCDQDGDIEMGMLALGQQGTEGGITSSVISSPSGGSALRKQHLLRRPSSGGDDGDVNSLNTSNDDYGNEESITEWLADAGTISTAVVGVGSGVAGGSSSHMLSGVAAAVTEMEHTTIGMSSTNSAADNQGRNDLEMTEVDLNNSTGDTVMLSSSSNNTNPSSPHAHVLLKTGAMNNNHNTTRRKRSGLA